MKKKSKPQERCGGCNGSCVTLVRDGDRVKWKACEACAGTGAKQQ